MEPNENNSKYQAVIPVDDNSSLGGLQRDIHAIHFRKDPASTNGFRLPNCQLNLKKLELEWMTGRGHI